MMQFFSKIPTLSGLILLLCPLLSLLSSGWPMSFWPPFCCGMLFSLFPLRTAMKYLPFRLWLFLCCTLCITGMFFVSRQNPAIPALAVPVLLGASACGLLLLLPPWLAVGRYISAAPFLGLAWSCSLLASIPLRMLLLNMPHAGVFLFTLFSAAGLIICGGRVPRSQLLQQPPHDFFGSAMVKTVVFLLCLLSSMGIAICLLLPKISSASDFGILTAIFFACGPVLSSCFIEKKGIYSSCILSIFLTETALILICSLSGTAAAAAGGAVLSLAAGSITVTIPVLAFYLCGRTGYMRGITPLLLCVPVSLLFAWPFWNMAVRGEMTQQDTAAFLLFLLIMSFLCIFFAWKRRFIVLKNRRI